MNLIQFSATWCGPCRQATKMIKETYDEDELGYILIDIDNIKNEDPTAPY